MAEIENGALIEGADGALYFIPDTILAQYKVEGDAADTVRETLGSDEVSGFNFGGTLSLPGGTDPISPLKAFQGPLNSWGLRANLGEEPTDVDTSAKHQFFRR